MSFRAAAAKNPDLFLPLSLQGRGSKVRVLIQRAILFARDSRFCLEQHQEIPGNLVKQFFEMVLQRLDTSIPDCQKSSGMNCSALCSRTNCVTDHL